MVKRLLTTTALLSATGFSVADQGKLSGVFFGDLYSVGSHSDARLKGLDGLWNRRFNLSYDRKLEPGWSMRLRIEVKDRGDFSPEHSVDPFMKDAWLRYTVNGHKITFGLIPTPSFEAMEDRLGVRHIERTPLDLWRMGSSRDKGISVAGPLSGGLDYSLMVGDGSGTRSSRSGNSTVYGRLGYKATPEVYVNLYGDTWKQERGARRQTGMAEVFYSGNGFKLGATYATQRRTRPGTAAFSFNVVSFYGEARLSDTVSPFVRYDVVSNALPDADRIDYYRMSRAGKPSFLQAGVRLHLSDDWELVPNVTVVSYRRGPTGVTPGQDTIFRLTFSYKF